MKKHLFRFLIISMLVLLVCGLTACKDKSEDEPSTLPLVMDTTISLQAYMSELVDPSAVTEPVSGIGVTEGASDAQADRPSPSTPGTPVNGMFFNDAVFVGDSVSLKLNYYVSDQRSYGDWLGSAKFLTSGSLGSGQALLEVSGESLHPTYQGQKLRIEDTIANIGAKKVFIMLGMNDIAVYGIEGSLDNYEALVEDILAKSPDAVIYAQTCTPMAVGCERSVLNNKNIVKYNNALKERCAENGWRYMDIYSVVVDADGFLKADYCSDPDEMGIHFTDAGCKAWVDYLMNNAG